MIRKWSLAKCMFSTKFSLAKDIRSKIGVAQPSLLLLCGISLFYYIIFKCIFLKEIHWILIQIPLKNVPKDPISNMQSSVHIMAWHLTLVCNFPSLRNFNILRPRRNKRHFADGIFKSIFLNENARISLKISLKFVPKVRINNILALVQIMAWRRPGDKALSEPMMVSLLTHICVTQPQWVNCGLCKPPLKLGRGWGISSNKTL